MRNIKRRIPTQILLFIILFGFSYSTDIKLAQTGFQFLSVASDARATAMGEAMTTLRGQSNSVFFNPASMARSQHLLCTNFSQNQWIADINHITASVGFAPKGGYYGVFALSMQSVEYGEVQGTMVWENNAGYIDTEIMRPSALALGVGYAKSLSDKFSIGGHIKSAYQFLGRSTIPLTDSTNSVIKNWASTIAYDFGTIYETGWKEFAFGMTVRNFSQEIKYQTEGFQLPLTFTIGGSIDLAQFQVLRFLQSPLNPDSKFMLSIDALHPRSYSERLNVGIEYNPLSILFLRTGYYGNYDERGITFGVGFRLAKKMKGISIDYAYTPFGLFDSVQQLSFQLSI